MASTCSTCKKRKVRCDGQKPICGSCANRSQSSSPCDYNHDRQHSPTNSLARGDACLPCRKKKKKCNGERPVCKTCITAKKTNQCVYNSDSIPQLITSLVERNRELEKLLGSAGSEAPPTPPEPDILHMAMDGMDMDSVTNFDSIWSDVTAVEVVSSSNFNPPQVPIPILENITPTDSISLAETSVSTFDFGQHSDVGSVYSYPHNHDFRDLREVFLRHGIVLGQSSTKEKWQALHRGDVSCTVIHPALVHIAQLFGARIVNRTRLEMELVDEEQHLTNALMHLTILPMTFSEAVAHIQCYCLLAVHYMKRHDITTGRDWLLRADELVRQFDLHIVSPPDGCVRNHGTQSINNPLYSDLIAMDEGDEGRDALCQLLYIDSVSAFRMQLPSLVSPRLRREFETLMFHYVTRMKEASVVVIRMASVLLLQEAHTAMVNSVLPHSVPSHPASTFAPTIRQIYLYLADVNELTAAASTNDTDRPKYLILKQCTLVAVTALASAYHLSVSSHPESQRKCLDSIAEIVSISDSLSPEDCSQLDPIISACWSIALRILIQIQLRAEKGTDLQGKHGVHVAQVPTFIETLHECASKVKWSFPLAGGIPMNR